MNGGTPTTEEMHFFYDAQSRPAMVEFGGAMYAYQHNLQGDIIGILDNTGNLVVEYGYDAWGNPVHVRTLTTAYEKLVELNPFRYRGYVWDAETGLYYLRSRYYNPQQSRFINLDSLLGNQKDILSNHLFCYCRNNAIMYSDRSGKMHEVNAGVGVVPSKKLRVKGNLVLYYGRIYKLYSPPDIKGPYITSMPKTLASGRSTIKREYTRLWLCDSNTYDLSSTPILNIIKDRLGYIEMEVTITQTGDSEPVANIWVNAVKNTTVVSPDGSLWYNSTVESGWTRLERLTHKGGYFYSPETGKCEFVPNEDGWLTDLIDGVDMVRLE